MKSIHRAEWKEYQDSLLNENAGTGRSGGIMSGAGVSSESIFSSNFWKDLILAFCKSLD